MKKQLLLFIVMIAVISLFMALWFQKPKDTVPKEQPVIESTNHEAPSLAKMVLPTSNTTTPISSPPIGSPAPLTDIETRYRQGLISKGEAIQETIMEENKKSQDFYGKVIDQYGQPIIGVAVAGELILNTEIYGAVKAENYASQTDAEGLFQFIGLHGAKFGISIKKEGYKYGDRREGYKGPIGDKTSPTDPAILTMWKLRGAEPLTGSGVDAKIPHDGSSTTFDIATGKESSSGDLRVILSRWPLEVRRGKDIFDWTVKIEMLHGGLVKENDPYPYWAPESDYQSSFEFNVSSNSVPWQNKLEQSFYIKNSQGQYGKMQFGVYSALTPARLQINFTVNPSGSRNLEPK